MAKSKQTWSKKEKEKKKQKKKEDKAQRKEERKANSSGGDLEDMIMYVDEEGNFTTTPPDPTKKKKIRADQIEVSVPKDDPNDVPNPIREGIVTFFDSSKGFGFIKDLETQESIFTHIKGHVDTIGENNRVTFQVEHGPKGLNAFDVRVAR